MTVTTRINFGLSAIVAASTPVPGRPPSVKSHPVTVADQLLWIDGTGADEADLVYEQVASLSASAALSLDLTALEDSFGAALSFARLKAFYLRNTGSAASLQIGGTCAIVGSGLVLRPGEHLLKAVGDVTAYAVTNSSSDSLTITNQSGSDSASLRLVLVGASA
mgnify:CR=1 FL=1